MKITLEIQSIKDWEILLPLLRRLKIKVIESKPSENATKGIESKVPQTSPPTILQLAGVMSEEEATTFKIAVEESRKIDTDEW